MQRLVTFVIILSCAFSMRSQTVIFQEQFNSSLGQCLVTNTYNATWAWSSSCLKSSWTGHSGPGHAIFQGTGCIFGNNFSIVKCDLVTPTIALPTGTCMLSFKYTMANELGGDTTSAETPSIQGICYYDVLSVWISVNGGTFVPIATSGYSTSLLTLGFNQIWTQQNILLSAYAGQTVQVKFNFDSGDGALNNIDGIYLDDISVKTCSQVSNAPMIVSPVNQVCTGQTMTISTSAPGPYIWNTGVTTQSIFVTATQNGFYAVTAGGGGNCSATNTASIVVVSNTPTLTASAVLPTICLGGGTALNAQSNWPFIWTPPLTQNNVQPTVTTNYTVSATNACGTTSAVVSVSVSPLPIIVNTLAPVCEGNPVQIYVNSTATSYTWLPGPIISNSNFITVTPLSNVVYTVVGKYLSCSNTATTAITIVPSPTLGLQTSANSVCQSMSVSLSASGASSYTWTPGGSNNSTFLHYPQSTTVYTLSGTNSSGCVSTKTAIVQTIPLPSLSLSISNSVVCLGNSATLTVTGAAGYSWSTGSASNMIVVTPTIASSYTVKGTSNGCSSTLVSVPILIVTPGVAVSGNTVVCPGLSTTLTAFGASTYTWNSLPAGAVNVIQPNSTTVYTVNAHTSASGISCPISETVQVLVLPAPNVGISTKKTEVCRGEKIVLTATGAATYSWNTGFTQPVLSTIVTSGSVLQFTVTGTDNNGCESTTTISLNVNLCSGIESVATSASEILVYPNPSSDVVSLSSNSNQTLSIVNALGQIVRVVQLESTNGYSVEIHELVPGTYFIKNAATGGFVGRFSVIN